MEQLRGQREAESVIRACDEGAPMVPVRVVHVATPPVSYPKAGRVHTTRRVIVVTVGTG